MTRTIYSMRTWIHFLLAVWILSGCGEVYKKQAQRPHDPWVFRSVLDKQPRMLTLALDTACYVAYDLSRCALYKAWKGGVSLEGAVYSDKKNVQPTSWGAAYFTDGSHREIWHAHASGAPLPVRVLNRGYTLTNGRITLNYELILPSGDTVRIRESPEFARAPNTQRPGLERIFETSGVPANVEVSFISGQKTHPLTGNGTTRVVDYFNAFPAQHPPDVVGEYDHLGRYWMENSDCMTCHEMENNNVGPSFRNIAGRYADTRDIREHLSTRVRTGGSGVWGTAVMNPHPDLSEKEIRTMVDYVFTLKKGEESETHVSAAPATIDERPVKPGFGAPLDHVHPAYELQTIHPADFRPRVGGLAFLPDGRLLVTTWDAVGGVYLLDGVETGDTAKISVMRIAMGLAEPLGIEVVDGEIYVLQKHELTKLIDHDGDDIIDEYEVVCDTWGVTGDFHEFAFGLVYKDGYFYVTLSMAMRLMDGQRQHPDRGKTIRISKDGRYEGINYGLRTPNGIGIGVDDELFVTDNQGQWLPANKLIHVKKGEYLGMAWGLPDTLKEKPRMAPPAIWLPDREIGNSPSEPVIMKDGPYRGQMLHGDVTNGGIKRDFLENVNGEYQGAVFRFSQGLEAGVNRLCWGPDGALYVGGVGMVGGWSWKEKRYGLERMKYNGKSVFEMLAVRVKPRGFEIEFTEPLHDSVTDASEWLVQQWWYLPTERYGGPKMDLQKMTIASAKISDDRRRVYLEIPGLKKEHVVYFRLSDDLRSKDDSPLWSSEAWYTLNNIPER